VAFGRDNQGAEMFVAVGGAGTVVTSPDGGTWYSLVSGLTNPLNGIAWGNNSWITIDTAGSAFSSPDGANWTQRSTGVFVNLFDVAFGNGTFVIALLMVRF
jgi:photosystem II stability/assembly factor-like uncharacterized protein